VAFVFLRRVLTMMLVAGVIGVLYVGIGAFGLVYRYGDPFMAFFWFLAVCS